MDFSVNTNDVEVNNDEFGIKPEGKYKVRVEKWEEKMSKSGKEYVNFQLEILDGPVKAGKLFYAIYESKMQMKIIAIMMNAFGLDRINTPADFLGKVGVCNLMHRKYEYNGENRESESIDAFKGWIPREKKEETPAPAPAVMDTEDDDEVPF